MSQTAQGIVYCRELPAFYEIRVGPVESNQWLQIRDGRFTVVRWESEAPKQIHIDIDPEELRTAVNALVDEITTAGGT